MRSAVRIGVVCTVLAAAGTASADGGPQHQVKQTPPIKMGTSGGEVNDASRLYCCSGTLGALVVRDGVVCILSNNHVLARSGSARSGDDTIQPGLVDVNCNGATANIVGDFLGDVVPLGTANVDTALSVARAGMVDTSGAIIDVGVPCATMQTPALNMPVMKSGRTTGFTTGQITSLNTSVSVGYQTGCNSGRRFTVRYTNQVVTTAMSAGGDSGSVLLSNDGTPNPVALLFAGSSTVTVYNPIQDVANAYRAGGHTFAFVGATCGGLGEPEFPGPAADAYAGALRVKVEHEQDLLKLAGVWGVGVGSAERDASKAVIMVFCEPRESAAIPKDLDGVPVRVILTDPIVAQ